MFRVFFASHLVGTNLQRRVNRLTGVQLKVLRKAEDAGS